MVILFNCKTLLFIILLFLYYLSFNLFNFLRTYLLSYAIYGISENRIWPQKHVLRCPDFPFWTIALPSNSYYISCVHPINYFKIIPWTWIRQEIFCRLQRLTIFPSKIRNLLNVYVLTQLFHIATP